MALVILAFLVLCTFPRWVWGFVRVVGGEVVAEVRGWRFDVVGARFLLGLVFLMLLALVL